MAEITLPGRNELVLCRAALCAIVEKHLNDTWDLRDKKAIKVYWASATTEDGATVFTFQLTTDPKEPSNG